ncbi:Panacea domain-containing protein [Enterococcus faecium]|uniref:Panacea domain-containing protein n=2 Tax=Enterococcus TaxID=1350 RepID=UPI001158A40F|nr:type II toxin-antitoxin system antitoxin SocA domain-containing protein [Enterococcus faecium]
MKKKEWYRGEFNMLKVMDIADFILKNRIEEHDPITNLELQKYLYFANAKFLYETGEPLFEEPIEKWKFGPVVGAVYHEYKDNRANKITELSKHESINFTDTEIKIIENEFNEESIPNDIQEKLISVINNLSKYDSFDLVEETHKHSEWKNDEEKILNGVTHLVYDQDALKKYFEEHEEARIW